MAKPKYTLNPGEKIVIKQSSMRHGFWGVYTDTLVITNQAVILEQYGMFNNFKGVIRYPMSEINQAIIGEASNGEKQIELYLHDKTENFAPQSSNEDILKTLVLAINDQLSTDAECFDYNYYQGILEGSVAAEEEIEYAMKKSEAGEAISLQSGITFAGDVAKNVLKSGDLSLRGVQRGISKATKKKAKQSIFGGFIDEFLDDIGVHDIQDCFTEIGNEFREEFGFEHVMTHEERREQREREQEEHEKALEQQKREAYTKQVQMAKQAAIVKRASSSSPKPQAPINQEKMPIKKQIEALKELKELLDLGILTQEEFERKKKEILN